MRSMKYALCSDIMSISQSGIELHELLIKGTISDPKFQTSLLFEPPDFFACEKNFTVMNYLPVYNNSLGNSIFLERDNFLLLGINFHW